MSVSDFLTMEELDRLVGQKVQGSPCRAPAPHEQVRAPPAESVPPTGKDLFRVLRLVRSDLLHKESGLGDAELRVYLFIVAQTMGCKKSEDAISLSQFRKGITKKNGEVWSRGTGLSTRAIIDAVRRLVDRDLIYCTPRTNEHGHSANIYALRLEVTPEAT